MASTDARPVPQKNVAYRVTFPILDADGDLVTGATGLDSEISKDGGTFADCTNEATEIATSSGMYYLDLTSTEMNADTVALIIKTSSSGAKTTPIVMYPEEAGDIRVNATQIGSQTASASGTITFPNATLASTTNITAAAGCAVSSIGADVITATSIAADAITDAKVASDVTIASVTGAVGSVTGLTNATIADAVWDEDATAHQTQGTFGQAIGDPGADTDTIFGLVNTNLDAAISTRLASAGYTAPDNTSIAAILVDTAEIGVAGAGLTALATQASVNTIDDFLDTEIAAIKAKTDNLPAAPAAVGDIPTAAANADAVWDEAIAGHLGVGSTGEALNAAGAAGDPWTTALPGAYGAGSAGFIIGTNINAPIGTVDTVVDAIKAKTDSLAFTVAGQVDANIQYVNDVAVTGDGQTGTEWGPA